MIVSFLSKDLWYRDDADIIVTQKLIKKEKTWVIGNPFEKFKEREVKQSYLDFSKETEKYTQKLFQIALK